MKKFYLTLLVFTLALCSIVYELILAQALSMFLHNTVLRYCVTIGLYLCALGIGALFAEGKRVNDPLERLQAIELLLSVSGGFGVVLLFLCEHFLSAGWMFVIVSHALVIVVGFLSGWELPLLIRLAGEDEFKSGENEVLAWNYAGAFAGTVLFAGLIYPRVGLITAAFIIGMLNACSGLILPLVINKKPEQTFWIFQAVILVILGYYFFQSDSVTYYFINQYLQS